MLKNNQKIPDGWSVKKLGELANHVKYGIVDGPFGSNLKTEHYRNSGIPVIQSGFVTSQRFYAEKYLYVDDDLFQREKRSATHGNDIIMAKIGAHAGTSAILPENHPESILAGNCLKITINPMLANNRFVLLTLHTKYDKDAFIDIKSTTAQPAISMENLKKLKLLLPPLPEQEKIAGILGTWDEAIEKLSRLIEQKKLLKKGLMQKLLTGKTRLSTFTQPWKEVKLGAVLEAISRRNKKLNISRVLSVTNSRGFILPEEQFSRVVASEDLSNYKVVKNGEFAYNPSRLNVGSIDRLDNFTDGILSPMYVIFKCNEKLSSNYMKHWITTTEFNTKVKNSAQGSVRETVDFKTLSSIKINLPSDISEQEAIADVLSTADDEINLLNQKLEALKEQKKGLMQRLLTGQIRVKVN